MGSTDEKVYSVAIIGSFKQHMQEIEVAKNVFEQACIKVLSPTHTKVVDPNIQFVRLTTDDPKQNDAAVQTNALFRILDADAVYVVVPNGYVGRTTCYEVGRVIQAGRPIYFSEQPSDLPVEIPRTHIVSAFELAKMILEKEKLEWLFASGASKICVMERRLIDNK